MMRSLTHAFCSPGDWIFKVGKPPGTDCHHSALLAIGISSNSGDNWTGKKRTPSSCFLPSSFHMEFISVYRFVPSNSHRAEIPAHSEMKLLSTHRNTVQSGYVLKCATKLHHFQWAESPANGLRYTKQHTWVMDNIKITVSNTAQARLPAIWTLLSRHPLPACT